MGFFPTHRHADGGLYQLMLDDVPGKKIGLDAWFAGVVYRGEDLKCRWTDGVRWAERFEEMPLHHAAPIVNLVDDEEEHVASFKFQIRDAGDVRYMLVTAAPQPGSTIKADQRDWLKRVLTTQAEAVMAGLHIRDHDFPDLIGDVNAFHAKFGQEYTGKPRILPDDLFDFRTKFHDEETHEYRDEQDKLKDAILRCDRRDIINSLELQLDALADATWVILGTADLQFGRRAFIEAWRRVYKANMLKVLATEDPDAADSGREIKYDIRKPAGWMAPDHRDLVSDNAIFDDIFAEPTPDIETNTMNQDADPTRYSDTRQI